MTEPLLPAPDSLEDCGVVRAAVDELNHGLPWLKYEGPREKLERPTRDRMLDLAAALIRWRARHAKHISVDHLIIFREKLRHDEVPTKVDHGIVAATLNQLLDDLDEKVKQLSFTPRLAPTQEEADEVSEKRKGPLGLTLDRKQRTATRDGKSVGFKGKKAPWLIFEKLCRNHPNYTPSGALLGLEKGVESLRVHINHLRKMLALLGVTVPPAVPGVGYVLEPIAPGEGPTQKSKRKPRRHS